MQYVQTIDRARNLLRTLEMACQSLYDDSAAFLTSIQSLDFLNETSREFSQRVSSWDAVNTAVVANLFVVVKAFEDLFSLGTEQQSLEQNTYSGAIEWRRSRPSVFYGDGDTLDGGEEDVVDMDFAISRPTRTVAPPFDAQTSSTLYNNDSQHQSDTSLDTSDKSRSDGVGEPVTPTWPPHESTDSSTLVATGDADLDADALDDETSPLFDDEGRESHIPCILLVLY